MTPERLATMRYIARWETITIRQLAQKERISYEAAKKRLERLQKDGLVRAEADENAPWHPGHGSPEVLWRLTNQGMKKLAYFQDLA